MRPFGCVSTTARPLTCTSNPGCIAMLTKVRQKAKRPLWIDSYTIIHRVTVTPRRINPSQKAPCSFSTPRATTLEIARKCCTYTSSKIYSADEAEERTLPVWLSPDGQRRDSQHNKAMHSVSVSSRSPKHVDECAPLPAHRTRDWTPPPQALCTPFACADMHG